MPGTVRDDNVVVRLQLVETPGAGNVAECQALARDTADAVDSALAAVLKVS